jgi:5-hydroxyisourate hydrolase-like protein (transthyretin family)
MRRPAFLLVVLCALTGLVALAACGGDDDATAPSGGTSSKQLDLGPVSDEPVPYAKVQEFFTSNCIGCHPIVNDALDLTEGKSYAQLVGVPAVEAPGRVRVVAGDPEASFLYQKIAGVPGLGDIPDVGTRMPPRLDRLPAEEIRVIRDWIAQGAKNDAGQTVSGSAVPTAGSANTHTGAAKATVETGSGQLRGRVLDQRGKPLAGAVVTLLLKGASFPDGEEHVRGAVTDAQGRYTLPDIPTGRLEAKAYAPKTLYVARIFEVKDGESVTVDFGLADRQIDNPKLAKPTATTTDASTRITVEQTGSNLDKNYTIAVHVASGTVLELRRPDAPESGEGVWEREIDRALTGQWIFLAADETCNVSEFLRIRSS